MLKFRWKGASLSAGLVLALSISNSIAGSASGRDWNSYGSSKSTVLATQNQKLDFSRPHAKSQLIVTFKSPADQTTRSKIFAKNSVLKSRQISDLDAKTFIIEVSANANLGRVAEALFRVHEIEHVEPNFELALLDAPSDPWYINGDLWGLYSGNSSPSSLYGSNASDAWALGITGSKQVYVAVLDTGIDTFHDDLANNIWNNSGEIPANGIDDDGNGYVDDVYGFDFRNDDGSVFDLGENPHGTHVAGILAAKGNNGLGVVGVNWDINLISAKIMGLDGRGYISDAVEAFDYVTKLRTLKGLNIVATNNSWGTTAYSFSLESAVKRAGDAGISVVAAAGNGGRELSGSHVFPASFDCSTIDRAWDCVVSVAAITDSGELAEFSNFGATTVDVGAPGQAIYSTWPANRFESVSGTSMATPFVAGALALCSSANLGEPAFSAKRHLLETATSTDSLAGKTVSEGRLNAGDTVGNCLNGVESFSGSPSLVRASSTYTDTIRLDWEDTVSGEHGYEIQIATGPAGCTGTFKHYAYIGPGLTSYPIRGLQEATFYCFRVRANHSSGNSAWANSNVSITWTSNLPFIYGTVRASDKTTSIANLAVKWKASGGSAEETVYTALDGSYVLQASPGVTGTLWVSAPSVNEKAPKTSIRMPNKFWAGGTINVSVDTQVDLTMPLFRDLAFTVTDKNSALPVPNAKVYSASVMSDPLGCQVQGTGSYVPSPLLSGPNILPI